MQTKMTPPTENAKASDQPIVPSRDLAFLKDKSQWPVMDWDSRYCCLRKKQDDGSYIHGFLLEYNGWEVFLGSVFDGGDGRTVKYESANHIIAKGWIVD